ncbi:hypothetical protein ABW21_db0203992 [Orbilia brochopaga]|nr:hypothetical protein ABW21_db0203992 [Drechslerella brochopaga]
MAPIPVPVADRELYIPVFHTTASVNGICAVEISRSCDCRIFPSDMNFPSSITTTISTPARDWDRYCREHNSSHIKERLRRTKKEREKDVEISGLSLKETYDLEEEFLSVPNPPDIKVFQQVSITYSNRTSSTMADENRPPTVGLVPFYKPTPPMIAPPNPTAQPFPVIHHTVAAEDSDRGAVRTQVLRGSSAVTGFSRHEFKREGQFGEPAPNPIGVSEAPLETNPANIRTVELDTNICKTEWLKSTIDWPYAHLFDHYRMGFDDAKYGDANATRLAAIKGVNFAMDAAITQPPKELAVVTEEFDYEQHGVVPRVADPVGGYEEFFERIELEGRVQKREQRLDRVKDVILCRGCNVT